MTTNKQLFWDLHDGQLVNSHYILGHCWEPLFFQLWLNFTIQNQIWSPDPERRWGSRRLSGRDWSRAFGGRPWSVYKTKKLDRFTITKKKLFLIINCPNVMEQLNSDRIIVAEDVKAKTVRRSIAVVECAREKPGWGSEWWTSCWSKSFRIFPNCRAHNLFFIK